MRRRSGFLIGVALTTVASVACGSGDEVAVPEIGDAADVATEDESESAIGEWTGMEVPAEWPSDIPIPEAQLTGWSDTSNSVQKRVETNWSVPGSSEAELVTFIEAYFDELRAAGFTDTEGVVRADLTGGNFSLDGEFVGAERTLSVTARVAGDTAMLYVRIPDVVFTMP